MIELKASSKSFKLMSPHYVALASCVYLENTGACGIFHGILLDSVV